MSSTPLVSIIIPTYNHAHFIQEALASVCSQTYENWEAIVVNNYSEDDTIKVVESFGDVRIYVVNFHNHGVIAASRNHAISLAKGELLAFLDSDDKWFPEKLEKCVNCFNDDVDLVGHGLRTFGNQPEYDFFAGPTSKATFEALLYKGNCLTPTSTVVRKDKVVEVGGFSEAAEVVTSEDYHLWIKLAKANTQMIFLQEVLGLYRIHEGGQSRAVYRHLESVLKVVEECFPVEKERTMLVKAKVRRRRSMVYYSAARDCQKMNKNDKAWSLLLQSLIEWPLNYKSYIVIALFFSSFVGRKK